MKRPNRKEYIGKATKIQLIADQEKYIDFIEKQLEAINYTRCSLQLLCVDNKRYTGITIGENYKIIDEDKDLTMMQ